MLRDRWLQTTVSGECRIPRVETPVCLAFRPASFGRETDRAIYFSAKRKVNSTCITPPPCEGGGWGVISRLAKKSLGGGAFSSAGRLLFVAGYFQYPDSGASPDRDPYLMTMQE